MERKGANDGVNRKSQMKNGKIMRIINDDGHV